VSTLVLLCHWYVTEYNDDFSQLTVTCDQLFYLNELSEISERYCLLSCSGVNGDIVSERSRAFHARISPSDNQAAERELRKELKSVSFILKCCKVVGDLIMHFTPHQHSVNKQYPVLVIITC